MELVDRLLVATSDDRRDAGLVFQARFQPVGGPGGRVMPPTYLGQGRPMYLVESRRDAEGQERRSVVLDQVPSQANRVERALLQAHRAGRVALPMFELSVPTEIGAVRLTSLDFPHRFADAYLRDSEIDGKRFHDTPRGQALRSASSEDVRPLFEREPYSLVFGAWDSHRAGHKPRFARVYVSEMYGLDPLEGSRMGGRMDPLNLTGSVSARRPDGGWTYARGGEKVKGSKLSELGHGHILAKEALGGVTVTEVHRRGWVSFAGLERMGFGDASPEAAGLARACLAALALAGDRLAFGRPSLELRSGCDLTRVSETVAFERDGGELEPIDVSAASALAAFEELRQRAAKAGLAMDADVISVSPSPQLAAAIRYSLTQAAPDSEA